jgi:hypothetical protein
MKRAMRIPRTLIPEVVSHVAMFLNVSGMNTLFSQCQISKLLLALYDVRFRAYRPPSRPRARQAGE